MPPGAPAPASIDLYNKLIHLPYSDTTSIGQIEFRLRQMRRKDSTDVRAAVALLQALLMSGKAEEAIELADWIWGVQSWLEYDTKETFSTQLIHLGHFDRSKEFIIPLIDAPEIKNRDELILWASYVATGLGDLQQLQKIAEKTPDRDLQMFIEAFRAKLLETDLERHFSKHQSIVHDVVFGHQCAYHVNPLEIDEEPELSVYVFVDAPRLERRRLEDQIDAALETYYRDAGIDPGAYVPLITTSILNIAGCPPPSLA